MNSGNNEIENATQDVLGMRHTKYFEKTKIRAIR